MSEGERSRNQENHESRSDDWQEHRNDEYGDRGEQNTTYGEAYGKPASKDNADRLASAVSCREPRAFIDTDTDTAIYIIGRKREVPGGHHGHPGCGKARDAGQRGACSRTSGQSSAHGALLRRCASADVMTVAITDMPGRRRSRPA